MSKTIYDIFISYRREGGGATAGRIYDSLTRDGYLVSYDVDTLREGRFDNQLLERIEQCRDFILVVDKNCFVRTIDPSTNPQNDWLRQELSYALRLKKNVIPIMQAGARFPDKLPADIDSVRYSNGPTYSHEYFDEFYKKLREGFLHAIPRWTDLQVEVPVDTANRHHNLKLKADMDCIFYLDGEERSHLRAGVIQKFPLSPGEYELVFVSEENRNDRLEIDFEMPDADKLQKINLGEIKKAGFKNGFKAQNKVEEEKQRPREEQGMRKEETPAKEKVFKVGGVEFRMMYVEGGSFMMGASESDSDAYKDEKPQHKVLLDSYYIGQTQVTQALWEAVMGSNPSDDKGKDRPVEMVSWNDCNDFIKILNRKTGELFRLPTEAEWEYAAKGGIWSLGFKYGVFNDKRELKQLAWYIKNSGSRTHDVMTLKHNELGLFDMSGNVWEWCDDLYGKYYKEFHLIPVDRSSGSFRVVRGGGFFSFARRCRVTCRSSQTHTTRSNDLGFRLVLTISKPN